MYKTIFVMLLCMVLLKDGLAQQYTITDQLKDCSATLQNGILTLENNLIKRTYQWNNGNIISKELRDKKNNYGWSLHGQAPDCMLPGTDKPEDVTFSVTEVTATTIAPAYLKVQIELRFNKLFVRRIFRIYPDCPAIACDLYMKGEAKGNWNTGSSITSDLRNIEKADAIAEGKASAPIIESLALPGKHWRIKAIEFFDVTDRRNNLVQENQILAYNSESKLKGNLLFADEIMHDHGLFILKEAPTSEAQLAYPGFDFLTNTGNLHVVGIGVLPDDLAANDWIRCYSFVTGVTSNGELGRLKALRTYQEKIRVHKVGRDHMVLLNTWGDRGQDKKIGEVFATNELQAAHKLGITHFQIDDGWQAGRSGNSAFAGGTFKGVWERPDYWTVDKKKFPNGFGPVVELGKKLGIEICVWFNPTKDSSYKHWQDDAAVLINLYKKYRIRTFKIDGVQVVDKQGDINLRKMMDTVMLVTDNQAVFNLDVTAGKRYGYHYFNEYGNIFLENRYTDWGNYYPSWTLRNLWMLSRYVPTQNLQIEFLNNFRNLDKYASDDLLAPSTVNFDYGFALTMMAQPLAWMEATGLPHKAFETGSVIKKYVKMQSAIHAGQIFPIGDEPSGTSWTGFQSIGGKEGYLLIIRERNNRSVNSIKTWLPPHKKVKLFSELGQGKSAIIEVGAKGEVIFTLPQVNNYALYRYQILN